MARNLVDLLDGALKHYAPLLAKLMETHQVHGITVFIGRDSPDILAKDENGDLYKDRKLQQNAMPALLQLVEPTYLLLDECRITQDTRSTDREPLNLFASRDKDSVIITAEVTNGLGGYFVRRRATSFGSDVGYMFLPTEFIMVSKPQISDVHVERINEAAKYGIEEVARYMKKHDLILNGDGGYRGHAHSVLDWIAAFPNETMAQVEYMEDADLLYAGLCSSQEIEAKLVITRKEAERGADSAFGMLREKTSIPCEVLEDISHAETSKPRI